MSGSTSTGTVAHTFLSQWTTLGVGGPAESFVQVADVASLVDAVQAADRSGRPLLVLGGGSNLVVADAGFRGTVVRVGVKGMRMEPEAESVVACVGAGEDWCDFVRYCVAEGFSGNECLSGIPGLTGATPVQNVGAYGQEVSETIVAVSAWDRQARALVTLAPAECRFGYRDSVFKRGSRYVVTEVRFRLRRSRLSSPLRYGELSALLGLELGERAPLEETAQAVIGLRQAKGMVLDASDPDCRSAGSFFTNPVLDGAGMSDLLKLAPEVPRFNVKGGTKVPAAWLVERAGFARGYRRGGAAISSKHALALTVRDGGTASDILALAREVRNGVRDRFGVCLEAEPVLVGAHL